LVWNSISETTPSSNFHHLRDTTTGTYGTLYGFNTTPGGSHWLGFPGGSATFTFANPTNSFGTFLTGLQQEFSGTDGVRITFNDGTSELLTPPVNYYGGAEYFGFTDTSAFTSLTITNTSGDAWGIDDTTFNTGASVPAPEPGTLALFGTALAGLVLYRRRRTSAL
jgi:hypothetical protein